MPPKKPLTFGSTVAIVAVLLVWVAPGFARSKANVVCGQVITSSVVFASDLLGCPATGLVVQGSNVTVDLNGHLLQGTGGGPGILIDNVGAGALAATVKNEAIEGFRKESRAPHRRRTRLSTRLRGSPGCASPTTGPASPR